MRVLIPSPLYSYTGGASEVSARGRTLAEVLADLDRQFPGIRFRVVDEQDRVREHMRFFVSGSPVADLGAPVGETDEVQVVCALSGG